MNAISPQREQGMDPFCFYQLPACILWALHALVLRGAALPPHKSCMVARVPPHFGSAIPAPPPDISERRLSLLTGSDLFSGESNDKKNYPDLPSPPPTFFLYEVIYTLGIEHRHCCCSRSVTDTSVTINGIYLP